MSSRQHIQGKEWAKGGTSTNPGAVKVDLGYIKEKPPYQTQNFLSNRADQQLAQIEEWGILTWLTDTEYVIGSLTIGSDGIVYVSIQVDVGINTAHDPISSPSWWTKAYIDKSTVETIAPEKTFNALKLGGNQDADNNKIINVATPTLNQDAANKAYADGLDTANSVTDQGYTDTEVAASSVIDQAYTDAKSVTDQAYADTTPKAQMKVDGVLDATYTGQESVTHANGKIEKEGVIEDVALNQTFYQVTFDIPFPTAIKNVSATISMTASIGGSVAPLVKKGVTLNVNGMEVAGDHSTSTGTGDIYWKATGY